VSPVIDGLFKQVVKTFELFGKTRAHTFSAASSREMRSTQGSCSFCSETCNAIGLSVRRDQVCFGYGFKSATVNYGPLTTQCQSVSPTACSAFSRDFIGGVLRSVPVGIVEIDDVYGGDVLFKERGVVIEHGEFFCH
jgi:hypothetical protein